MVPLTGGCACVRVLLHNFTDMGYQMKEKKERKEKNMPLGVIQEKLLVKPKLPLASANVQGVEVGRGD